MLKYGDRVKFIAKYPCAEEMYEVYEDTTVGYAGGMFDEYMRVVNGEITVVVSATSRSMDGTPIVRIGGAFWYMEKDLARVPDTLTEII